MMKLVWRNRPFTDYTSAMMKYEARYEEFVNKRYKEPEDGNFEDVFVDEHNCPHPPLSFYFLPAHACASRDYVINVPLYVTSSEKTPTSRNVPYKNAAYVLRILLGIFCTQFACMQLII